MQQEVTSMDFGTRSNPDLTDLPQQEMFVPWEVLLDKVIIMLLTPMLDLVSESSNWLQGHTLAEVYQSVMMKILGKTIEA